MAQFWYPRGGWDREMIVIEYLTFEDLKLNGKYTLVEVEIQRLFQKGDPTNATK